MCLVLFGYQVVPGMPLLVAANRDEFHGRATAVANFWEDSPHVIAGRDLEAGGTWLGCNRQGYFAALTNFSSPDDPPRPISRGLLVQNFLNQQPGTSSKSTTPFAKRYAEALEGENYAGFNLLLYDGIELVYASNRVANTSLAHSANEGAVYVETLKPGYYGLSNAELGANWPKCMEGADTLKTLTQSAYSEDDFVQLMADRSTPPDDQLPQRGRPLEMERRAAAKFIMGDEYGTRASTVVMRGKHTIKFFEHSYAAMGKKTTRMEFEFPIEQIA